MVDADVDEKKTAETSGAVKLEGIAGITAAFDDNCASNDNGDAAANSSSQHPDSPSANPKRKRRVSVSDVRAAVIFRNDEIFGEAPAPATPVSYAARDPNANSLRGSDSDHSVVPPSCQKHLGNAIAANNCASSHSASILSSPWEQQTHRSASTNGQFKRSDTGALHRPSKVSRGLLPQAEADMLQRKQGLLEKLKAYGSNDEHDFEDEEEGDVSGEDTFSDDDGGKQGDIAYKEVPAPFTSSSLPASSITQGGKLISTQFGQRNSFNQWGETHIRLTAAMTTEGENGRLIDGGAGRKQPFLGYQPPIALDEVTERAKKKLFNGVPGQKQPFQGVSQSVMEASQYSSYLSDTGNLEGLMALSSHPGIGADFDSNDLVHNNRVHSNRMFHQRNRKQQVEPSMGFKPPQWTFALGKKTSPPTAAPFSKTDPFRSSATRRGENSSPPEKALTAREKKTRGIFANLEAQIMEKEGLNHSNHTSCASPSQHRLTRGDASVKGAPQESVTSCGSSVASGQSKSAYYNRALHSANLNDSPRRGTPAFPNRHTPLNAHMVHRELTHVSQSTFSKEVATPSSGLSSNIEEVDRATLSKNNLAPAGNLDSHKNSRHIIANMEAVMSHRAEGDASTSGRWKSRNSFDSGSFQRRTSNARSGSSLRGPSREVIASIEADIMRLEEEEKKMETIDRNHRLNLYGPNAHSSSIHGSRQPAGMNQRDVLSIMMMQQQQRQQQGMPQHAHGNGTLADQISNMAIDPLRLEADDDSSAKSINSCISYDGKCTNIFASRAQTQEQELACHALNNAICDLYGAPVKRILGQYPMVTRLIRADDETGNIQLHYAVRHGNVKAIRRIVRADPGCALIRNIQGYCPLHFAVQIGNFAAVQQLCCMVPASAEVQCEEGCLPLHEAVSSAAHLPDAPQITATLINTFPSAIKITNDEGLLPLHLAAMSGISAGIRTIFAYGFSTIYARENTEGMLPLDFAIEGYKTSSEEANEANETRHINANEEPSNEDRRMRLNEEASVAVLTQQDMEFRQCIDILLMSALYDRPVFTSARSDQRGMTFFPIHGAAAAQPCSQSWKQIVSMYGKEYASGVDVRGRTALHVLVTSTIFYLDLATEMISDINELDPTSATTFDDSGLIPLHAALMHLAPYSVIEYLLISNWSTISVEVDEDCDNEEFRRMLPFQLASACGCSLDIVNLLLRTHPMGVLGALPKDQ